MTKSRQQKVGTRHGHREWTEQYCHKICSSVQMEGDKATCVGNRYLSLFEFSMSRLCAELIRSCKPVMAPNQNPRNLQQKFGTSYSFKSEQNIKTWDIYMSPSIFISYLNRERSIRSVSMVGTHQSSIITTRHHSSCNTIHRITITLMYPKPYNKDNLFFFTRTYF